MHDTPLGNMVAIRSEENKDILKGFTPEQRRIRTAWRKKMAENMTVEEKEQVIHNLETVFKNAFS